jgi:hypothetical protein
LILTEYETLQKKKGNRPISKVQKKKVTDFNFSNCAQYRYTSKKIVGVGVVAMNFWCCHENPIFRDRFSEEQFWKNMKFLEFRKSWNLWKIVVSQSLGHVYIAEMKRVKWESVHGHPHMFLRIVIETRNLKNMFLSEISTVEIISYTYFS